MMADMLAVLSLKVGALGQFARAPVVDEVKKWPQVRLRRLRSSCAVVRAAPGGYDRLQ